MAVYRVSDKDECELGNEPVALFHGRCFVVLDVLNGDLNQDRLDEAEGNFDEAGEVGVKELWGEGFQQSN